MRMKREQWARAQKLLYLATPRKQVGTTARYKDKII
jgi:hypothetical protein